MKSNATQTLLHHFGYNDEEDDSLASDLFMGQDPDDPSLTDAQREALIHNALVRLTCSSIVRVGSDAGGPVFMVMALESIVASMMMTLIKEENRDEILSSFFQRVSDRIKEAELALKEPAGTA